MTRIHGSALFVALALTLASLGIAQQGSSTRQEPTATARATADQLFLEGRQLLEAGDYTRACAKFKESHALDPAGGALLNLAACYERDGKTASAWRAYNEALAWANADHREDRSAFAVEHIRALEPQLARLVLSLPPRVRMRDITVIVDGETLDPMYGVRIPVDPGQRVLEIEAKGRETFKLEVAAVAGEEVSVSVPHFRETQDETKGSTDGGTMSMGGGKTPESGKSGGPAPIRDNPGACGCRTTARASGSPDRPLGLVALSAVLGLLLL